MNGQDKGAEHFAAFTRWAAELTDADARSMVRGGQLNRAEICKSVGCARAVLRQNPGVKAALEKLEEALRARGVLPPESPKEVPPLRQQGQLQRSTERERLRQLEVENAALQATVSELRRRLQRLETLDNLVSQTGRLPR